MQNYHDIERHEVNVSASKETLFVQWLCRRHRLHVSSLRYCDKDEKVQNDFILFFR